MKNLFGQRKLLFVGGLIMGALIILGVRYYSYEPADKVHYHANFSLYINGQRELFKDPFYYTEESGSCESEADANPKERAHMHDGVNNVVHVEDQAVTWGQFFQNLGWVVDNKVIESPTQMYLADDQHKISFVLNGQTKDYISNLVIGDKEKLLVDYGTGDAGSLSEEYKAIPATAAKYDTEKDPASCGGSAPTTMRERMKHLF